MSQLNLGAQLFEDGRRVRVSPRTEGVWSAPWRAELS